MMGTEIPAQVSLLTEVGGFVKLLLGIAKPFRTHPENWTDPTIKQTIVQYKQATGQGNSDRDYFQLGSFYSGTDVTRYRRNIDNCTGMNPQGSIVTMAPESNSVINCYIFDFSRRMLDLTYKGSPWHGAAKSENLGVNKSFENSERKNNFEVEKFGRKSSVI